MVLILRGNWISAMVTSPPVLRAFGFCKNGRQLVNFRFAKVH